MNTQQIKIIPHIFEIEKVEARIEKHRAKIKLALQKKYNLIKQRSAL